MIKRKCRSEKSFRPSAKGLFWSEQVSVTPERSCAVRGVPPGESTRRTTPKGQAMRTLPALASPAENAVPRRGRSRIGVLAVLALVLAATASLLTVPAAAPASAVGNCVASTREALWYTSFSVQLKRKTNCTYYTRVVIDDGTGVSARSSRSRSSVRRSLPTAGSSPTPSRRPCTGVRALSTRVRSTAGTPPPGRARTTTVRAGVSAPVPGRVPPGPVSERFCRSSLELIQVFN